jgi:hypothetical protein
MQNGMTHSHSHATHFTCHAQQPLLLVLEVGPYFILEQSSLGAKHMLNACQQHCSSCVQNRAGN